MRMQLAVCLVTLVAGTSAVGVAAAQVELDRILVKVAGRALTSLDVRQARAAHLVADVSSDAAVQQALENRLLALAEIGRAGASPTVTDADVSQRRNAWEGEVGGSETARRVMAQVEIDEGGLAVWFRDDLRIARYLDRQFGSLTPADRARATADWFGRLRQRADLR